MKIQKLRHPVKRNPMAAELARNALYRGRTEATTAERAAKADPWNRAAKHKTDVRLISGE